MKTKINWDLNTDLTEFEDSKDKTDAYRHHDMVLRWMKPATVVAIQLTRQPDLKYKDQHLEEEDVWKGAHKGDWLPTIVLEYDKHGQITPWQEGYRRSLTALRMGERVMPVWIATKRF